MRFFKTAGLVFLVLLLFSIEYTKAQNVFMGRDYWQSKPSIEDIKAKINEENDLTEMNTSGFNPAVYAIISGMPTDVIIFILEQDGNDLRQITHDGRSYLHWSAMAGQVELMRYLVENGIAVDQLDEHGYTEFNFAAATRQKSKSVYEFLIDKGADPTKENTRGANALLLLMPYLNDFELINFFESKGLSLNAKDKDGHGAFYYAAKSGNISMMQKLVEKNVSFEKTNGAYGNAFIAAAEGTRYTESDLDVYEFLDELGIDPNVTNQDGNTPLHILASKTKNKALIDYFLDHDVELNLVNSSGNTAFMYAAGRNNKEMIEYLYKKGDPALINQKNKEGQTPIMWATKSNGADVVKYLFDLGAGAKQVDADGNNLAYYLHESFSPRKITEFEEKQRMLLEKGVSLTSSQSDNKNLLHLAVEENSLYLVENAVSLGVDVNQKDVNGLTPLHLAAMKAEDTSMLTYLIKSGADKTILTDFDESVYDLAHENEILANKGIDIQFLRP